MRFGENGPSYRQMEPSRFLADLPPELFGLAARPATPVARAPLIRRHPGSLDGDPHIELDDDARPAAPAPFAPPRRAAPPPSGEPTIDYSFDQRADAGARPFARGERVLHASLGEGSVLACDGLGGGAKVTVFFDAAGEKRVLARFLRPAR
jgi:DNA helicase-2/ATP-dependent DNA helicase PcrA